MGMENISFTLSVVWSRTALDTKQQPRIIREDKNLIERGKKRILFYCKK